MSDFSVKCSICDVKLERSSKAMRKNRSGRFYCRKCKGNGTSPNAISSHTGNGFVGRWFQRKEGISQRRDDWECVEHSASSLVGLSSSGQRDVFVWNEVNWDEAN